jgi:hypothetical protein
MPSILVRAKIITRFLGTEPRVRIYEYESTDAKWPVAQTSVGAGSPAMLQCQPVTWSLPAVLEGKLGRVLTLEESASGQPARDMSVHLARARERR